MPDAIRLRETYASLRDLCELFGLTPRAIRFYEERGLIESRRDPSNWRRYDSEARGRLALIAALRRADLPVDQISDILELAEVGASAQVRAIQTRLAARLERLESARQDVARQLSRLQSDGLAGWLASELAPPTPGRKASERAGRPSSVAAELTPPRTW
jgi:DNA-binding transcriptional MerR regulator